MKMEFKNPEMSVYLFITEEIFTTSALGNAADAEAAMKNTSGGSLNKSSVDYSVLNFN